MSSFTCISPFGNDIRFDNDMVTYFKSAGLLTAAVAKAQGHTVIISEPSGLRRKKAQEAQVADYFFKCYYKQSFLKG